jgi:hypothetical protein
MSVSNSLPVPTTTVLLSTYIKILRALSNSIVMRLELQTLLPRLHQFPRPSIPRQSFRQVLYHKQKISLAKILLLYNYSSKVLAPPWLAQPSTLTPSKPMLKSAQCQHQHPNPTLIKTMSNPSNPQFPTRQTTMVLQMAAPQPGLSF